MEIIASAPARCFTSLRFFHRRTANGRPYGSTILEHRIIVGASIARPVHGARPIRIKNGAYRFCVSPTGD
ncbi:MAG: hypothetical protein ACI3VK_06245, partial [Oscillospiraceae bacterium]